MLERNRGRTDGDESGGMRPPRTVFHVTPFPPEHGGIGEAVEKLLRASREDRVAIVLANVVEGPRPPSLDVRQVWRRNDLRFPLQIAGALRRATGPPGIAHVQHHFFLYGDAITVVEFPLLLLLLKLRGYRVLTQLHSVIDLEEFEQDIGKAQATESLSPRLMRMALRRFYTSVAALSDMLLVQTDTMARLLTGTYGIPEGKVAAVPLGWDATTAEPRPAAKEARNRRSGGAYTIVFHGFLDPTKGLEHLLRAFALVAPKFSSARLVLVGEVSPHIVAWRGSYLEELSGLAARLGIRDRVLFTGYVTARELEDYLAGADLFVLPYTASSSAGASIVLSKIAILGKPLIASRVPRFMEELVPGDNAMLVAPEDVVGLAQAIETVITSPDLAGALGRKLRLLALGRSWERIAERMEAV